MKNIYKFLFFACIVWLFYYSFKEREILLPDGILINEIPVQNSIDSKVVKEDSKYIITALATYDIKARVLAKKNYLDRQSDISKTDLALGWERMSSNELLKTVRISQGARFYFWYVNSSNFPRRDIETQSANVHIIAANKKIERQIKKLNKGNLIQLKGYLVEIKSKKDRSFWKTSLTRNDTGAGACEIIYVESIEMIL